MASWVLSKKAEGRIAEALAYKLNSLTPGTEEHGEWAEFVANLRDEMPEAFKDQAMTKERKTPIRIHVVMFGGTIDGVFTDAEQPVRVVFTEDVKYSDNPDDCVRVPGETSKDFIYSDHDAERVSAPQLDPVWQAAEQRGGESAGEGIVR